MPHTRWIFACAGASAFAAASALAIGLLPMACEPLAEVSAFSEGETRLTLHVRDAQTGAPLPALVTFRPSAAAGPAVAHLAFGNFADLPGWAQGPSAVELGGEEGALLAFRHGMALWRGDATIPVGRPWKHLDVEGKRQIQSELPPGQYLLQVSHGVEYDAVDLLVDLSRGRGEVEREVNLRRVVDSTGYVSADLHVHNAPESSDAHATALSQLKVAAVNGLEVVVAANHEVLTDLQPQVAQLWPRGTSPLSVVPGMEKGGTNSHFGVFPLQPDVSKPGKGAPVVRTWPLERFFGDLRSLGGRPVVVLNHPRLGWQAYMDEGFCGAWARRDFGAPPPCPQDYDAFEVLNGWQSCGTRMRDATETWLALATYNIVSAAVGGSDSHYVSAMVPGYPRTWVRVEKDTPAHFDPALLAHAIRARHTIASNAPLVTLRSGSGTEGDLITNTSKVVPLSVRVQAANWVTVDTVRLLINGALVKSWAIPRSGGAVDFRLQENIALGKEDAFITVETDSQAPLPPHLVGEYNAIVQYGLPKCAPRPGQEPGLPAFAVTSPLFVDRDGDGLFRAPRATVPRTL